MVKQVNGMKKVTYKSSGVDITKANDFIRAIKPWVSKTKRPGILSQPGAFGSLMDLQAYPYRHPVLVSSTDGVGTKLLVAKTAGIHDTVGIDLVAMNVNDILCAGARPLFFMDYIACGRLDIRILRDVVKGIVNGCRQAGCALLGGETAEMPGMYTGKDYDLAGFAVGVVERHQLIDGSKIRAGDAVIGLASSGLHSNGYSLVRRIFSVGEQRRLARELLKPTRIYVREILPLLGQCRVHGLAHITGGAFYEKLTKVLPSGLCFAIDRTSWPVPKIFKKIQEKGKIEPTEMLRTFNMGIGMAVIVPARKAAYVQNFMKSCKLRAYRIGRVIKGPRHQLILE